MKKIMKVLAVLTIVFSFISCSKQARTDLAKTENTKIEKMTVGEFKVRTGIDLIKSWEESKLPENWVARSSKGKKPQSEDIITVTWSSMSLTSTDNGDGTITHTWVLPANPKWSAMQHADALTTSGLMDFSITATGVFSFANYYQYSYFLAGLPYITSATYSDVGGYYRVFATDMTDNVFVSDPTNPQRRSLKNNQNRKK